MANLAYQVTNFAYQGAGQFAYQGSVDGAATTDQFSGGYWPEPKRKRRTPEDIRKERIEFGILPPDKAQPQQQADTAAYFEQSARIARAIATARAESADLRAQVAALEAEAQEEGIRRTLAEQARLERRLLLAQQQLTLLSVQEAVLIEEMEVIDVAFLSVVSLSMVMQ